MDMARSSHHPSRLIENSFMTARSAPNSSTMETGSMWAREAPRSFRIPAVPRDPLCSTTSRWTAAGLLAVAAILAVVPLDSLELLIAFFGASVWMCVHISQFGIPARLKSLAKSSAVILTPHSSTEPSEGNLGVSESDVAEAQEVQPPGDIAAVLDGKLDDEFDGFLEQMPEAAPQEEALPQATSGVCGSTDLAEERDSPHATLAPAPAAEQLGHCVEAWARRRGLLVQDGDGTAGVLPPAAWQALVAHWVEQHKAGPADEFELQSGLELFVAFAAYYATTFDWHLEAARVFLTHGAHGKAPNRVAPRARGTSLAKYRRESSVLGSIAPKFTATGAERVLREFRNADYLLNSGFSPEELLGVRASVSERQASSPISVSSSSSSSSSDSPQTPARALRHIEQKMTSEPPAARSVMTRRNSFNVDDDHDEEPEEPAEQDGNGRYTLMGTGGQVVLSLRTFMTLWLITPQGGIL